MASVFKAPRPVRWAGAAGLLLIASGALGAQDVGARAVAYKVRRATTVSGAVIDDAVIVVERGKIVAIGKSSEVEIPFRADVVDLPDATATPGFIHIASLAFGPSAGFDAQGRRDGGDRFVADELQPRQDQLDRMARNGFTRLNVIPSDGGVAGHGCLIRPVPDENRTLRPEHVILSRSSSLSMGFAPRTTAKTFWRELFAKVFPKKDDPKAEGAASPPATSGARRGAGRTERNSEGGGESRPAPESRPGGESRPASAPASAPAKDPKVAPFVDVVERRLPGLLYLPSPAAAAHFEPFLKEYEKFRPTFVLTADAWRALDVLKPFGVSVVLSTNDSARPDTNILRSSALEYMDAGFVVALIPETSPTFGYPEFPFHLSELVRRGAEFSQVLRSVTMTPAEILGIADETGSLESGKTADILFWAGDPLSPTSRIVRTLAGGMTVYDETKEP